MTLAPPSPSRAAAPTLPRLTQARAPLTHAVEGINELGEREQLQIPAERPLTIYVDKRELVTQVTFYDPIGLVKPQSAVYVHESRPDLEEAGVRIRMWECTTSSNSYKDAEGNTQFYLPGDPQYKDPRGFTDFPELPGQSLNPIFDEAEAQ